MIIKAKLMEWGIKCSLKTDVGTCGVCYNSGNNDCPQDYYIDDELMFKFPDFCPLIKGNVIIEKE
jgi:hypothetical protein